MAIFAFYDSKINLWSPWINLKQFSFWNNLKYCIRFACLSFWFNLIRSIKFHWIKQIISFVIGNNIGFHSISHSSLAFFSLLSPLCHFSTINHGGAHNVSRLTTVSITYNSIYLFWFKCVPFRYPFFCLFFLTGKKNRENSTISAKCQKKSLQCFL